MYHYSAYGLRVGSDIPLSEFVPLAHSGPTDVVIQYGDVLQLESIDNDDHRIDIKPGKSLFWFRDVGSFEVLDGSRIHVAPVGGADESLIRLYIEGMMMASLLHQRGLCVLHSSVVDVGGHAIAFLGPVGAGKSSIAAALHARGHRLISDDNAAIAFGSDGPAVFPAYPYVKLYPAIAESLGYGGRLRLLHSTMAKMAGDVNARFADAPVLLRRLYFLRRTHPSEIQTLAGSELILQLVLNSVPARWGGPGDAAQLHRCGRLALEVEAFTIRTFDSPSDITKVAELVEEHCGSDRTPKVPDHESSEVDVC